MLENVDFLLLQALQQESSSRIAALETQLSEATVAVTTLQSELQTRIAAILLEKEVAVGALNDELNQVRAHGHDGSAALRAALDSSQVEASAQASRVAVLQQQINADRQTASAEIDSLRQALAEARAAVASAELALQAQRVAAEDMQRMFRARDEALLFVELERDRLLASMQRVTVPSSHREQPELGISAFSHGMH